MRKDWEYKKLGDIITPAKVIKNGDRIDYPILSITMRSGIILQNERFKKTIASVDTSNYKIVQNGQLVIAFPIDEGLIYTQDIVEAGIMSPAYNIWNIDYSEMNRRFLVTYLHSPYAMSYYKSKLRGTTMRRRSIPKADLLDLTVPFPPMDKQVKIIEELDKINELIRLKKEQLKDFDNLAQSIFYEMFGDPVENERGWEVKKLGEICEVTSAKRVFIDEVVESGVPFIRGTELTALSKLVPGEEMDYTLFITYEHYKRLKAITGVPRIGDLLIPSINADGIVWMVDTEDPLYFKDGRVLWVHVNHEYFNSIAIQKLMNVLIKNVFFSMGGATFAELKLFVLRNMIVPTPPLSVQNAFSEKIKQIDDQKLRVKKSITDLETLLASRMQYWFE